MGQLLESDWLAQVSQVQSNSHTCGYDIARFINTYQVCTILALILVNNKENQHKMHSVSQTVCFMYIYLQNLLLYLLLIMLKTACSEEIYITK